MENKFYILESLRSTDPKTGIRLYVALKDKSDFSFYHFDSKQSLCDILGKISIEASSSGKKAFVHFDCHGNEDGIGVVKGNGEEEFFEWRELSNYFRKIYKASNKRSVLSMSSCKGFNAVKIVPEHDSCPYDYVCGSFEKIGFTESFNSFKLFYDQIIQDEEIIKAALQVNAKFSKLKFICLSAVEIFELSIQAYIREKRTPEQVEIDRLRTIENAKLEGFIGQNEIDYINYRYSDEGIAKYFKEWREVFFS